MPRKPKRPDPIRLGDRPRYTVRPMDEHPEEGWRWRLEWYTPVAADDGTRESKLRTLPLGRFKEPAEAQAAALVEIANGKAGGGAPKVRPGQIRTLDTLLRAFLAYVKTEPEYAASTKKTYAAHVARLCGRIGDIPVDPVPAWGALDRYRVGCLADGYKPVTVRQDLVILQAAWTYGMDRQYVHGDLPRVAVDVPSADPYTPPKADILRLLARLELWAREGYARKNDGRRRRVAAWVPLAARLYWATGARRTELAALEVGDVRVELGRDPEDGPYAELRLGRHEGARKTGGRTVPIADYDTAAAIAAWLRERGAVTPSDGFWGRAVRSIEDLHEWMHRACDAEGLPHFTTQSVRRAVTDALFEAGADPKVEAQILGHSDATALRYYRKPRASSLQAAVLRAGLGRTEPAAGDVIPFPTPKGKG